MLKSIRIGAESFHKLIESDSYYVDKTHFIKTVFKDNTADVMLITRPRRFGKTLTMSTFYDFLSLNPDNPGDVSCQEKWFKDTYIFTKEKAFCDEYMGKFPVIYLTLKSVCINNFHDAYNELAFVISNLAGNFKYLESSQALDNDEKQKYRTLLNYELLKDKSDKSHLINSLNTLTQLLFKHHGIHPILLIDEYDVPIAKAAHYGYYDDMIGVISPFLGNALKTNTYLGRAILTGCLRAAKESIFTGLNNLLICSVLDTGNNDISEGIGFTKEETQEVMNYYGLTDYCDEVRKNYDGYYFGTIHMYCPWDVMSFCYSNYRKVGEKNEIIVADNYWINTSGNDAIEEFMDFIEPKDIEDMQNLLDGKSISTEVRKALCYGDLRKHDITDFWTLLLYTGYLTFDPMSYSSETKKYNLYIPNEEIRDCFRSKILNFYKNNSFIKNYTNELIRGLFEGDAETVEQNLNNLLKKYVSIRDFSVNAPKENYYHGFINGLLVNGTSLIEEQKSNLESGDGYVDIIVASRDSDTVAILELKQTDRPFGARLIAAQKAVEQIIEKDYASVYISDPLVRNVYAYGICFHTKSCSVVVKKMK